MSGGMIVPALVTAAALLGAPASAMAAQIFYRWVDESGAVHYTQSPPPSRPAGPPVARPVQAPATPGTAVDEVLELSGLKVQLAQLPQHVLAQAPQLPAEWSPQERSAVLRALAQAFRIDTIYPIIKGVFAAEFDAERIAALLRWLRAPGPRRMVELEMYASSPAAAAELQAFAAGLDRSPPSGARLALVRRLDDATATTEIGFETLVAIAQEVARATGTERMSVGELENMMRSRADVHAVIADITLVTLLFTYRAVPDGELAAYVATWESDVGRWFSGVWRRAYLQAIQVAARRFADQMPRTLSPRPAQ